MVQNETNLAKELKKYFHKKGNRFVFRNGFTLNQLAGKMAEICHHEPQPGLLSKVINSKNNRGLTPLQIEALGDILRLTERERWSLRNAYLRDEYLKHNLDLSAPCPLDRPPRSTHFIGREAEIAQILEDLQPSQVITLCGPGGVGKTAIATEVIWRLAPEDVPPERFPDGIFYHCFYNQSSMPLAFEEVARAFGEDPTQGTPSMAAKRALRGKRALLFLDGAEEAEDLSSIIELRSECTVLITSRRREDSVSIRRDIHSLSIESSMSLLRSWGGQRAEDENAARKICESLGGLPLAICLAGKYIAQTELNAAEYLASLQQTPLQSLQSGDRQHLNVELLLKKSLHQVSDNAHQALGVIGRLALTDLSPKTVAVALDISVSQVGHALGELVNYGLLLRFTQRYEVSHPLIHAYARQELSISTQMIERLAFYYVDDIIEEGAFGSLGFARLHAERPHMLAILNNCLECDLWFTAEKLSQTLDNYLDLQGYWFERISSIEAGLVSSRALNHRTNEIIFLNSLGSTYVHLGNVHQGIKYLQEALTVSQKIGNRQSQAQLLNSLGVAYRNLGNLPSAIEYSEKALIVSQNSNIRSDEAVALGNLGLSYRALGDVEKAIEFFDKALIISREIGDKRNEGVWLAGLSIAYRDLDQVDQAVEVGQLALTIVRKFGDRRSEGDRLTSLASAYRRSGQIEQAINYLEKALIISREIGDRRGEGNRLLGLGNAFRDLGELQQSLAYLNQALHILEEIEDARCQRNCLDDLGDTYSALGKLDRAIIFYQQALAISHEIQFYRGEIESLSNLANAYYQLDQVHEAQHHFEQALAIAKEINSPYIREIQECLNKLDTPQNAKISLLLQRY